MSLCLFASIGQHLIEAGEGPEITSPQIKQSVSERLTPHFRSTSLEKQGMSDFAVWFPIGLMSFHTFHFVM